MNIFAPYKCPWQSAASLDNSRVIKMVLETAQLLSTTMHECAALHELGDSKRAPYKPTHRNHPCSIWARASTGNYEWLLDHYLALGAEYTFRFKRTHKSSTFVEIFDSFTGVPKGPFTTHFNCTEFKHIEDVNLAYRCALSKKWTNDKRAPSWGPRDKPEFYYV